MPDDGKVTASPVPQARQVADRAVDLAAEVVNNVVSSEPYSALVGWYMRGLALTTSAARGVARRVSGSATDWLNLPTRDQVTDVAARITRLELAVDDIEFNTEDLRQALEGKASDG